MNRWRLLFWATLNVAANLCIAGWFAYEAQTDQSLAMTIFDEVGCFAWSGIAIYEWHRDTGSL